MNLDEPSDGAGNGVPDGDAHTSRGRECAAAMGITLWSLIPLGAGSWLYRVFAHGLGGGSAPGSIIIDYVVIGVVYVGIMSWVVTFSKTGQRPARAIRTVVAAAVGFTVPVIAFCIANIVIEASSIERHDESVASAAAVIALVGPTAIAACTFGWRHESVPPIIH